MTVDLSTDAAAPNGSAGEPDAYGQAAMMLAESMLHTLVESSVLTNAEALDILTTACEVKREVATAAGESAGRMQQSLDLLLRIRASFATDEVPRRSRSEPGFTRLT